MLLKSLRFFRVRAVHVSDAVFDDVVEVSMHSFVRLDIMICGLEGDSECPDSRVMPNGFRPRSRYGGITITADLRR